MNSYPKVSVILPVRNEESYIKRTLMSVIESNYPADCLEIIVVDGMSGDRTRDIVKNLSLRYNNITLLNNPPGIAPTGLNIGIEKATGQIIMRLDGHVHIVPDYIRVCVEVIMNDEADCVGGHWITDGDGTLIPDAISLAMSSYFGVGGVPFRCLKKRMFVKEGVPFFLIRKEIFQRIGLFNEDFVRGQDDEFFHRLDMNGVRKLLLPEAACHYFCRRSLMKLWSQYFQYGFWKARLFLQYPHSLKIRHFVFFISMTLLHISFVASFLSEQIKIGFWSLFLLYVLVNLLSTAWISLKNGIKFFTTLPAIFLAIHLSYFWGFIFGLVKWPIYLLRKKEAVDVKE